MKSKINAESDVAGALEIDPSSGRRKGLKRWATVTLLVAAVVTSFVIWNRMKQPISVQYRTQEVVRGDLTVIVTATGTLKPTNEVEVGSELSGTAKSVEADYNSKVKVGQVLAKLDTTKLEATLTQSRAALESAKAKVLQAQATVAETLAKLAQLLVVRRLSNGKVPSQLDIDAAEAAFDRAKADQASAKAAVSQAEATVKANETDLSKSIIRSPINGIVLTRSIEPGQTVAATMTTPVLFTLAEDLTQMELHVNVDEADIGKVQEGQEATFSVAAYPNRTFEARITQVRYGSSTTSGVVTYETVLKVNNSDLSLRPGMTATADIMVKKVEKAILIPSAALRFTPPVQEEKQPSSGLVGSLLPRPPRSATKQAEDGSANKKQQRVWTLTDGQLSAIPVTIGSTDGRMTEVVSGDIKPGMALVVDTANAG
ncbi:MAG TPA: efflux RND transporter periplasmic adaptor subunit [Syntrophobacteraceae bacterium]|nr:efflux RND transporter periplasmic adaptor subunit [Syntrophobacteraceae bacterium]